MILVLKMAPVLHGRRCIHAPADLCVFGDLQPERRFYVHRLLLMCISPYFEKVFRYRAVSGGPVADCAHCTLAGSSHDARTPCTHQTTGDQQKQNSQRSSKRDLSLLELTSEKPKASRSTTLTPDNKENESSPRPQFNDSTHEEPAAAASHSRHDTFVGTALVSNTISLDRPGTSDPIDLSGQLLSTSNAQSTTKGSSPTKSTNLKKKDKFLQVCDCISNNATNDKHRTSTGVSRSEMLSCQTFESLLSSLAPKMEDTTHQWFDALPPFLSPPSHDQPLEQLKLSGLDGNQVEALIQFAYDGKIELTAGNVQSLLLASDMYSVQSLFDQCQQFLIDSLGTSNCVGVYVFSQKMQCARLETAVEHYILRNFELVSTRSVEFPHLLSEEQMLKLLLQHRLYVSDEYLVFLAIVRWIQFDKLKRASSFAKLFTGVRLALVSDQHLVESMLPHPLLNSHPQFKQLIERVLLCKSQLQLFERPDEQLLHDFELQAHLTPRFPLDLIFVFGGRTLDVEFVPPEPVVEVYDHRAERWRQVSSLQEPLSTRDHHQTVVLDGDIYLLGGHSGPFNVYNSCRKFSLKTKKWVEIAPMREKRAFLAAVVWNKSIYAIGTYILSYLITSYDVISINSLYVVFLIFTKRRIQRGLESRYGRKVQSSG